MVLFVIMRAPPRYNYSLIKMFNEFVCFCWNAVAFCIIMHIYDHSIHVRVQTVRYICYRLNLISGYLLFNIGQNEIPLSPDPNYS